MTDLDDQPIPAAGRRTGIPPGWLFLSGTVAVTLICFYLTSVPDAYPESFVFGFLAWAALLTIFVVRLVLAGPHGGSAALPSLLVLVSFVVCLLGLAADLPYKARFALSERSLAAYAADVARGGAKAGCEMVGLYYVCGDPAEVGGDVEQVAGGAMIIVTDPPLMSSRGFLWLPGGAEPSDDTSCEEHRHLSGPWWACKTWDGW